VTITPSLSQPIRTIPSPRRSRTTTSAPGPHGDSGGRVWISYNDPEYLRSRYDLTDELMGRVAGVGPLVNQAIGA
jgi:hypothetical protein